MKLLAYYNITLCFTIRFVRHISRSKPQRHIERAHTQRIPITDAYAHAFFTPTRVNNLVPLVTCPSECTSRPTLKSIVLASSRQSVRVCLCKWVGKEREATGSCRRSLTLDIEWRSMLEHVAVWPHTDSHDAEKRGRERERETLRLHLKRS